jgi:arylsulfatase A-like enzyme
MVESMDDAVGTLLDTIDRLGLAEKTIIIFTSDNGGNMYNEVEGAPPTSNSPLRGGKATMFEGGTRVPCVIAWPGVTAAGERTDALIQSEDFYPTLMDGLGLKPEANQTFDGASLMPALRGEALAGKAVFQYFPHDPPVPDWIPPSVSIHQDDWKLIRVFHAGKSGGHRSMLYHLKDDIGETKNLAPEMPEKVKSLDALIDDFLASTKALVPVPNPKFDPSKYRPELEGVRPPAQAAKPARRNSPRRDLPANKPKPAGAS